MKAPTLLALALSISTAQAGEQEVALACNGTLTTKKSPQGETIGRELTSQGVIVNFGDRTIRGLAGYLVEITESDDTVIGFSGREQTSYTFQRTDGTIDRVTGNLRMSQMEWEKKKPGETTLTKEALTLIRYLHYELICKPTKRVF